MRLVRSSLICDLKMTTLGPQPDESLSSKLFGVAEVVPGLYLCGAPALTSECLSRLGITCLVSAAPELPPHPASVNLPNRHCVDVRDTRGAPISIHLHPVADLIHQVEKESGRTLVHCVAGVSRSASLILAYLVKYRGMSLSEAFAHLKSRRPCVRPNTSFFSQLIDFERQTRGTASVEMVFNEAARAHIPDLYEPEYKNTIKYQQRSCGSK